MIAACIMTYGEEDVVQRVRPAHHAYIHPLVEAGRVISGGTLQPDHGGLFLYRVADLDEARGIAEADPFVREGALASWELFEYEIRAARPDLYPTSA
jgi:uncharacterized protein